MPRRSILIGGQRLIMAIGGALRAAIKAGNFVSVARESRRRARALAELNASGGISRPGRARGADDFLRRSGVDVDAMTAPGTGNPYMDWVSGSRDMRAPFSSSPFGGVVFDETWRGSRMGTGPRTRIAGDAIDYNLPSGIDGPRGARPFNRTGFPIEAPYEGFRSIPAGSRMTTRGEEAFKQQLLARRPQTSMTDPADAYMERFNYGDPFYNPAGGGYVENWRGAPGDMYRYSTPQDDFLQTIFNRRISRDRPVPPWAQNVPVEIADEVGIFPAQTYEFARNNPSLFIPPSPRPPSPGPSYYWDSFTNSWEIPF